MNHFSKLLAIPKWSWEQVSMSLKNAPHQWMWFKCLGEEPLSIQWIPCPQPPSQYSSPEATREQMLHTLHSALMRLLPREGTRDPCLGIDCVGFNKRDGLTGKLCSGSWLAGSVSTSSGSWTWGMRGLKDSSEWCWDSDVKIKKQWKQWLGGTQTLKQQRIEKTQRLLVWHQGKK